MTDLLLPPHRAVQRLIAAYKLRLVTAAEQLDAQPETWRGDEPISRRAEERLVAGEDEYRLSPYPYPGLRSFDPFEGEIFFGREHNVEEVQGRLVDERIVVVLGGSGSGKSSLLRAGLLPYLNTRMRIPGRDGSWYKAEFRPRKDPLGELVDAVVDQWLLPLLELGVPGLAVAMGLPERASKEEAREPLRNDLRNRFFDGEAAKSREVILRELLDLTGPRLDQYDRLANAGLRVPRPSIMLLLDQFEEVFRPEISPDARASLLNLIVDLREHLIGQADKGSLFLAITMRSEELHRCAEHRGLADVINHSVYLLELLDPREPSDRSDLHRAIVQPARNVFDDWGLQYDRKSPDAPFAPGMPDWLLEGSIRSSSDLEHRPDQLPLLQHALQATWDAAIRRWSDGNFDDHWPTIERSDVPGQADTARGAPDLGACLHVRVDEAAERAAERFAAVGETSRDAGEAALRAAFRALARRDDNGTWARRFAEPDDITCFMSADPTLSQVKEANRWEAIRHALDIFLLRGYLSGGRSRPYDISHEALIRNWPRFREWLREPEEVAYALGRVLAEVEPAEFLSADDQTKIHLIPADVAGKVALLGDNGQLPERWAEDQIASLLKPATRQHWGNKKQDALREVVKISALADRARERLELKTREREFVAKQTAAALAQANELAEARRKIIQRTRAGLAAVIVLAIAGTVAGVWASMARYDAFKQTQRAIQQTQKAILQAQLKSVSAIEEQVVRLKTDKSAFLGYVYELDRDAERRKTTSKERGKAIETQRNDLIGKLKSRLARITGLLEVQRYYIYQINETNKELWFNQTSQAERDRIVNNVVDFLRNDPTNSQGGLRIGLYAAAAIPQNEDRLNEALRTVIANDTQLEQLNFFTPPTAQQIYGFASDPNDPRRAAVGDDNGVVWLWNPLDRSISDPGVNPLDKYLRLDVAPGIVNGVAFNADGSRLAAAHRDAGVIVWDSRNLRPDSQSPGWNQRSVTICQLRRGASSGAYGVAFHGTILAVASSDGAVHLLDVSNKRCDESTHVFKAGSDVMLSVAFSPDGEFLAAVNGDGTVAMWKISEPERPYRKFRFSDQPMFAIAFSPNGKMLAAAASDGTAYLWDMATQQQTALASGGGRIGQIAFSPDGKWLIATAKDDGTAIVTDLSTGKLAWLLEGEGQALFGVAFSSDSKYILTGNLKGAVGVWLMDKNKEIFPRREDLINLGLQRLPDRPLTLPECRTLQSMQIPVIVASADNTSRDDARSCPLLWPKPSRPNVPSQRTPTVAQ
jgi:DNA-binding beta-propeller fold protein YncE